MKIVVAKKDKIIKSVPLYAAEDLKKQISLKAY